MEYRVLKYFLAVAQEENITKAADIIHISQPALSRQLMQLEDELGVKLFDRVKHRLTLTPEGLFLRRRAMEIVELTEKTVQDFQTAPEKLSGTISIGSGESDSFRIIALCIKEFSKIHSAVKFDLYSNNGDFIREQLEKGLLDIGIIISPAPADLAKYEYMQLPDTDRWGIITAADNPLAGRETITPHDLIGQKLLISKRAEAQGFKIWAGESYSKYDVAVTYNLSYNAAVLVIKKMGVALTIEGAVSLYHNPQIVFRPFFPELTVNSFMIWKRNQPQPPAAKEFIKYVAQQL